MLSQLWGSGDGTETVITDWDQCHGEVQLSMIEDQGRSFGGGDDKAESLAELIRSSSVNNEMTIVAVESRTQNEKK